MRGLFFRAGAILLALLPFVVCETALWLAGWQPPSEFKDPFAGFDSVRPLFQLNNEHTRYETADSRLEFFARDWFAASKGENEFRVFVLGGSTVQGHPFSIETAFARWLELSLQAADPSRDFRVVNCGGVSYASYRLNPIVQEVLQYEPDLIILYMGHNDFLEDWTHEKVKSTPAMVANAHRAASNSRTYRLCRKLWLDVSRAADSDQGEMLSAEVAARLDEFGGLAEYHRDDRWRRAVVDRFRWNLRSMIEQASQANVPVITANPVCLLRDCPPFKTEDDEQLGQRQRDRLHELWDAARQSLDADPASSAESLLAATQIDPGHAGVWYDLARCYESLNQIQKAHAAYVLAKDYDVCPLRVLESTRQAIREVAHETAVDVVDVQREFEQRSRNGIVDEQWMVDHVHPTIDGHKLIAELFFKTLVDRQVVAPSAGWEQRRDDLYRQQLDELNYAYYERGRQRLEGLKLWTQGRARKKPQ